VKRKLEILHDLRTTCDNNKRQCAEKHGIQPAQLRAWLKIEDQMIETESKGKRRRVKGAGVKPKYEMIEAALYEKVIEERTAKKTVNYRRLKEMATDIAKVQKVENFAMTDKIAFGFVRRHNLVFRAVTHVAQQDNRPIDQQVGSAINHFGALQAVTRGIPAEYIYNMDETPCYLDMASSKTLAFKGEKNIEGSDTGHAKTRFTVVLTVSMSGRVLKTMVILKGLKKVPKIRIPNNIIVAVSMGGSMNEALMGTWIERVIDARSPFQANEKGVMVMDRYGSHMKEAVKESLEERKLKVRYVPAGMTSLLQPLDVAINAAFKAKMREQWEHWFVNGKKEFTSKGNRKRPSWEDVVKFVSRSVSNLDTSKFRKAFECCGITENGQEYSPAALNTNLKKLLKNPADTGTGLEEEAAVDEGEEEDFLVEQKSDDDESDVETVSDCE
jgi:hypothetical protein